MRGFLAIAIGVCIAPVSWLGAQTSLLTRADTQAAVAASRASAGRWWLDVVFPPLTAQQVACRTGWSADRIHERPYLWRLIARPRGRTHWDDPYLQVDIQFWLPIKATLTRARLDSALVRQRLMVDELSGEPPRVRRQFAPTRAWARVERGRVRVRVEGEEAAGAMLRARNDSVTIAWCNGWVMVPYVGGTVTLRQDPSQ